MSSGGRKKGRDSKQTPGRLKTRDEVRFDAKIDRLRAENELLKRKYNAARKLLREAELEHATMLSFQGASEIIKIKPQVPAGGSEATAFMIASDWHVEEEVKLGTVNNLNKYDLAIADLRAKQFFQTGLRLVEIMRKDIEIKTLVLALLGDFFSNDIHEELAEINQLLPMDAALMARDLIASGIQFLLENSTLDLVIPCHSGNHGRTTAKVHISTERGHSLEYMMYASLAGQFKIEPRVKFLLAGGYHSYIDVYGMAVRFHHGHQIRYQGGVGGIYIPCNKAIAQWNKAKRADLDVFGHFHQAKHGGNFISNGSLIGYNAYAISIKADFEPPKQSFFLIDRRRGQTVYAPILFDDGKKESVKK